MYQQTLDRLTLSSDSFAGEQAIVSNQKNLYLFPYSPDMMQDSFIHLLSCGKFEFGRGSSIQLDTVSSYRLFYIYEGSLTLTMEGEAFVGKAGHILFFHAPARITCELPSARCSFFHAAFAGAPLKDYASLIPRDTEYPPEVLGTSCLPGTIQKLLSPEECTTRSQVIVRSKWINDILTELCAYYANPTRSKKQLPAYLYEMKHLLDTEYQNPFSLEEFEQHFDISRYRLCREFSSYFGESPLKYVNHRRIEAAKQLLVTTTLPIHEIGSLVGIENTNHFINLFKRETGATPLVFRQEAPVSISELHYPYIPDAHPQ
ncbi:MAG: AraC family transcriptional regulator [Agathobacter sp.]